MNFEIEIFIVFKLVSIMKFMFSYDYGDVIVYS